jgi:hypothetical protein
MGDRTAAWGQVRVANELKRRGLSVSAAGVRCVWRRHELETMQKRLKALEAKSAQEGLVLSEAQLAALEEAKGDKEAHGELRTQATAARRTLSMGDTQGRGAHLPADLPRHLHQAGLRQTLMIARPRWWRPICSMTV